MRSMSLMLAVATGFAACTIGLAGELRLGIIGLDTSHVTAFTRVLNDANDKAHVSGARVTAAFRGGSRDIPASWDRVDKYTRELQDRYGVAVVDSIEELCRQVDAVMLESVDGRPHLEQAKIVIRSGKPLFIDKPMAASLKDAVEIFELARQNKIPVFSASSLRFGKTTQAVRNGAVGKVTSAETSSPVNVEPHHPELFWYGIHGVESLFTVMGAGCKTVRQTATPDGKIQVTGTWSDGRKGVFRQSADNKSYGGTARGKKGESAVGGYDGYAPLVAEIVKFFQTGVSPVPQQETLEILAFMEAAEESKRQGGKEVSVEETLKKCQSQAQSKPAGK